MPVECSFDTGMHSCAAVGGKPQMKQGDCPRTRCQERYIHVNVSRPFIVGLTQGMKCSCNWTWSPKRHFILFELWLWL